MFKRILIAYDGSSFSEIALRRGFELAHLCQAELHLVGILSTTKITPVTDVMPPVDIWEIEEKALEEALSKGAEMASAKGLNPATSVRKGNPAHEIAAYAAKIKAEIVVIGHSDKGILARWFEGSVGAGLLKNLPCDLLIATDYLAR